MKRLVIAAVFLTAMSAMTACHTVQGVGKDVTAVGKAGENAVDGK